MTEQALLPLQLGGLGCLFAWALCLLKGPTDLLAGFLPSCCCIHGRLTVTSVPAWLISHLLTRSYVQRRQSHKYFLEDDFTPRCCKQSDGERALFLPHLPFQKLAKLPSCSWPG